MWWFVTEASVEFIKIFYTTGSFELTIGCICFLSSMNFNRGNVDSLFVLYTILTFSAPSQCCCFCFSFKPLFSKYKWFLSNNLLLLCFLNLVDDILIFPKFFLAFGINAESGVYNLLLIHFSFDKNFRVNLSVHIFRCS